MTENVLQEITPAKPEKRKATRAARRGAGSIFKQPGTDRYTIQYFVNGRRKRESTGTDDPKQAQQKLTQRLAQADKGEPILINRRLFVSELLESLKAEYVRQERKSLKALKLRIKHVKPFFGDMHAARVNKETIEAYVDSRIKENAARATINRELACLKRAFRLAAEKLPRLPVFPAQLTENNTRVGFVEDAEFSQLTANASGLWLRAFLEIAYTWGWRVSEILGLQVRQVDLKERIVRLESSKNGEPRECTMTTRMHQLLKECCAGKSKDDFVLTRTGNRPVRDFRKAWESLCKKAEIPELLVHDLRRSAARNLRRAGVAESIIMSIGGWKTPSMFRRYAIVSSKDKLAAMEQLEQRRAENSHSLSHNCTKNSATPDSEPRNERIN